MYCGTGQPAPLNTLATLQHSIIALTYDLVNHMNTSQYPKNCVINTIRNQFQHSTFLSQNNKYVFAKKN